VPQLWSSTKEMINQDILESIRNNLPAIAGDLILQELEELKELRNIELKWKSESAQKQTLKDEIETYKRKCQTQDEINTKLKDIETRERNLKVLLLEHSLTEAKQRTAAIEQLVSLIFRHPVTTRQITGQMPCGIVPGTNGNIGYAASSPVSTTETVSVG
jgi:hypothetical protein